MEKLNFQWHLTNRCNLRCIHCYQEEYSDNNPTIPLLNIARRLLFDLEKRAVHTHINLTGGEPLLLGEDLTALISLLDTHPLVEELSLITNGTLLDQTWIDRLSQFPKLRTIKISLEGGTEKTNDFIRGRGVYRQAMCALELLEKDGTFQSVIMATLHRGNMEELQDMLFFLRSGLADGLIIERFIPEGRGRNMVEKTLHSKDWWNIIRMVARWAGMANNVSALIPYRAYWVKSRPYPDVLGAGCDLGASFCLMCDGTVYPCRRFPLELGNIFTDGLWTVCEGAEILRKIHTRSNLAGKCGSCTFTDCFGCRALGYAFYRDPFAEDFQCPLTHEELLSNMEL